MHTFTFEAVCASVARGPVTIRGISYALRLPTAAVSQAVADLFPMPTPPWVKNPLIGSARAEPIRDDRDPAYAAAVRRWSQDVDACEACYALGLFDLPKAGVALTPAWADAIKDHARTLQEHLTRSEIAHVLDTARRLTAGLEASAEKN